MPEVILKVRLGRALRAFLVFLLLGHTAKEKLDSLPGAKAFK